MLERRYYSKRTRDPAAPVRELVRDDVGDSVADRLYTEHLTPQMRAAAGRINNQVTDQLSSAWILVYDQIARPV